MTWIGIGVVATTVMTIFQIVQIFSCIHHQLNQKWNFTGDIMSGDGCLVRDANSRKNGAKVRLSTCIPTSLEQDWDYYW